MRKIAKFIFTLQANLFYTASIFLLALLSIFLLGYEIFNKGATAESIVFVRKIDLIIAYIFLTDFFIGFAFSHYFSGRKKYFKDNWLNLASSIPISSEIARAFRLLRILRAMRILRAGMNLRFAENRTINNFKNNGEQ